MLAKFARYMDMNIYQICQIKVGDNYIKYIKYIDKHQKIRNILIYKLDNQDFKKCKYQKIKNISLNM